MTSNGPLALRTFAGVLVADDHLILAVVFAGNAGGLAELAGGPDHLPGREQGDHGDWGMQEDTY